MSKKTIVWLVIGAFLVILGSIIFACVMMTLKWNFLKLSTAKYETNTYEFTEKVEDISIKTDTADVVFVPSSDSKIHVTCYEADNQKHTVTLSDGALVVEVVDTRKWYEYIGINFSAPKITVSLPAGEYGELEVEVSTGRVKLDGVRCEKFASKGSTGDISMKDVIAKESIFVERGTGNITIDGTDAAELYLKTTTGQVKGSVLTDKVFIARTDTGRISVPNGTTGGRCEIITDTGNINVKIK